MDSLTVAATWKENALAEMQKLQPSYDYEAAHMRADAILCELLVQLGHADIVSEFEKVRKWYG